MYQKTNSNCKPTTSPLISVVIPAYNYPELLKNTLESVVRQSFSNIEILVIDDGSEEDLSSVVNLLNDERICYYKLEHTNANVARNYGISKSKGKYIAMLDADDIWCKNHLEDCIHSLQNADGLYGSIIIKPENSEIENTFYVRSLYHNETMIDYLLNTGCGAQTSTLFLTAESAKKTAWNPNLYRHQDYDFIVRYTENFKLIPKINPTVLYIIRNKKRHIDFHSCINFINANKKHINPHVYIDYNKNMYWLARKFNAPMEIINHYQKESQQ